MVAHHVFCEGLDVLIAGFSQRLLGRRNIDHTGGICDMGDLRISGLCALRKRSAAQEAYRGHRRAQSNEPLI